MAGRSYDQHMSEQAPEVPGYSRAERIMAIAGIILAAGLLLVCADVAAGGRVTGLKRGCGCQEEQAAQ
jgi:hypothetical protein